MRKINSQFQTKFISEIGKQNTNKDYFAFVELDNFACWVVADGFDESSEVNSARLAVEVVISEFTKKPTMSARKLKQYILKAHAALKEQSVKTRLKASLTMVVTDYTRLVYGVAGNTRFHIFRDNQLLVKSKDQSLYQRFIDEYLVPDDSSKGFEERNNLLSYLGSVKKCKPYISKKIKLEAGDILLLCTSGFFEKINTIEMIDAVTDCKDGEQLLEDLQELLLSKQQPNLDNYTIVSIFANKPYKEVDNRALYIKWAKIILIPLFIIILIISIYIYYDNQRRAAAIATAASFEQKGDVFLDDENFDRALKEYVNAAGEAGKLNNRWGEKARENKAIKDRLGQKERMLQLLVDGDTLYEGKKYEQAQKTYQKAKKALQDYTLDENKISETQLEDKIILSIKAQDVVANISMGDRKVQLENFVGAAVNYYEADKIINEYGLIQFKKEIDLKLDQVQSQLLANEKKKKLLEGSTMERRGDLQFTNLNYAQSMEFYNIALSIYEQAEDIAKVTGVQKKIDAVSEQIRQVKDNTALQQGEELERRGDQCFMQNDMANAKANYQQALDIFQQNKNFDRAQNITKKLNDVAEKEKDAARAKKLLEAQDLEAKADQSLTEAEAVTNYRLAQSVYQEIGALDKVLAIEAKIKQRQEETPPI